MNLNLRVISQPPRLSSPPRLRPVFESPCTHPATVADRTPAQHSNHA